MKIKIGNKTQQSGYFEVGYTFILDVPQMQRDALAKASEEVKLTQEVSGVAGYKDETKLPEIQADLVKRYNKAQESLNVETKTSFLGMTWDGKDWL
jgi:hypothetical protein